MLKLSTSTGHLQTSHQRVRSATMNDQVSNSFRESSTSGADAAGPKKRSRDAAAKAAQTALNAAAAPHVGGHD